MRAPAPSATVDPTSFKRQELAELLRVRYAAADQVRRGVCFLNAGRFDEAAAAFRRAEEFGSMDRSLPAYLAAALLGQDRPVQAAESFARIADDQPHDSVNRIRQALSLWSAGDGRGAVETLRSAVRDDPECAELHFQLGTLLSAMELYEEAELRFTQAISIERDHAQALVSLALCHAARRSPEQAVPCLQRAQTLRPHDALIGSLLAAAAKAAQEQGHSIRVRAAVAPADEAHDQRGIAELAAVIEQEPDFVDAFLSIPTGQVDEAVFATLLATLQLALERQPEHAELHFHCGRVLDRLGRRGDAIDANERAVQIDPTFIRALIELGKLYHDTDRTADAASRLEEAIRQGAEYADVYFMLGNLYRDQGRVSKAQSAYRKALAINARFEAAQKALAELGV